MVDGDGLMEPSADEQGGSEPLSRWQRIWAGMAGGVISLAGGFSVFRTTNQAGSVALMVVGGAFLLMSLTGAPINKVKINNSEVSTLPIRRRAVARDAQEEAKDDPDLARQLLEVLKALDPAANRDPVVGLADQAIYRQQVITALRRVNPQLAVGGLPDTGRSWLGAIEVVPSSGPTFHVSARQFESGADSSKRIRQFLQFARDSKYPQLLVVNRIPPSYDRYVDEAPPNCMIVRWLDTTDDGALRIGIQRLLARTQNTDGD